MKRIALLILVVAFSSVNLYALDSLGVNLRFETDTEDTYNKLVFGLHRDATHNIDKALGEIKAPEFPPPDDLYATFLVRDSTADSVFWSYYDFRPFANVKRFARYYRFLLFNISSSYDIKWDSLPRSIVDSAFVQDLFSGQYFKVDMLENNTARVDNFSLDQFEIVVYFNVEPNGKRDEVKDGYALYPNPANSLLRIRSEEESFEYSVYNALGERKLSGFCEGSETTLDASELASGCYFVVISKHGCLLKTLQFVKSN